MPMLQGVSVRSTLDVALRYTVPPECRSVELAESSTESQVADTVSDAARTPDDGVAEALSATKATMPCEPAAGSLSMVLQIVPLLQKVSLCPAVVSQKISTNPSLPTSTDDVAVSITGFSRPPARRMPRFEATPKPPTPVARAGR